MKLIFKTERIRKVCTGVKEAKRSFGGDAQLVKSLLARINALEQAETLHDIIVQPTFHFHDLGKKKRDLRGYFAIDVKSHKEAWRIILRPLDEDEKPYVSCHIDEISHETRIVEISEVSNHYE